MGSSTSPSESLLFPNIITSRATQTPNRTFAHLPSGSQLSDGFYTLSYSSLARGVNKTAFWLDSIFGGKESEPGSGNERTVAYIGPDDLRYALLLLGCIRSRRKLFLPLPTNTPEGQVKLLKAQGCAEVFASKDKMASWGEAVRLLNGEVRKVEVPTLEELLGKKGEEVQEYPYERSEEEGLDDSYMVIQTSGTTGDPKPIRVASRINEAWADFMASLSTTDPNAQAPLLKDSTMPLLFPISWAAGLVQIIGFPLNCDTVPILLPPTAPYPMTPEYVHEVNEVSPKGEKNGCYFIPTVLRELSRDIERLKLLGERYDWLGFMGAPLDHPTGDLVRQYVPRLQSFMGSTDTGTYPFLQNSPEDWKIHRIPENPPQHGFFWELFLEEENLYELCIGRAEENEYRHCFVMDPDPNLQVYHTKDLFRAVPGRAGFYENAGRVDDFVKLGSLTKFNSIKIEQILDRHEAIKGSLVAGEGRIRPFVIVQPDEKIVPSEDVVERLWPAFEEANQTLIGEAKLAKEFVIVTKPGESIRRTAKGTVDRKNTLKAFEGRIEELYNGKASS